MLLAEQELYMYMYIRFYILHACYMHVTCVAKVAHSAMPVHTEVLIHRQIEFDTLSVDVLQLLFLKEKKLETVSVCYHYLDFFLLGRVAVNWANALKLNTLLIE